MVDDDFDQPSSSLEDFFRDAYNVLFELILCPNQPFTYAEPRACFWVCQYFGTYGILMIHIP